MRNIFLIGLISLITTAAFASNNMIVNFTIHNDTGQPLIVSNIWKQRCHSLALSPQLHSGDILPEGDTVLVGETPDGFGTCDYNFVTNDNDTPQGRLHLVVNAIRSNPEINISSWGNLSYVEDVNVKIGMIKGQATITKRT